MDNALRLIGIAKKAGRLEIGEEPVGAACRARQAKLILLASDAAENSLRRGRHFAEAGDAPALQTPFTKEELGGCVGRTSCAMLAVTDAGLSASMAQRLAESDPERYGEAAGRLAVKAGKVLERQKEQRAHEKNLQRGGKKPWAAPAKGAAAPPPKGKAVSPKGENAAAAQARIQSKQVSQPRQMILPKGKVTIKGKIPAGFKKTP